MRLLKYEFRLSTLLFNLFIVIMVLIAMYHLANRVQVCDLTIQTSFPCGTNHNYTLHQLDYYALNYYLEFYYMENSTVIVPSNCSFKLYPLNLK